MGGPPAGSREDSGPWVLLLPVLSSPSHELLSGARQLISHGPVWGQGSCGSGSQAVAGVINSPLALHSPHGHWVPTSLDLASFGVPAKA